MRSVVETMMSSGTARRSGATASPATRHRPAGSTISTAAAAALYGAIIASVVPPLDSSLTLAAERYFHMDPLFVTPSTDTGLKIEDVECGDGAAAEAGMLVTVHYTGTLEDGTKWPPGSADQGDGG